MTDTRPRHPEHRIDDEAGDGDRRVRVVNLLPAAALCSVSLVVAAAIVRDQAPPPVPTDTAVVTAGEMVAAAAQPTGDLAAVAPETFGLTRLDEETVERFFELVDEIDPDRGVALRALRERDPAGFERAVLLRGRRLLGLLALQETNDALFCLKRDELRMEIEMNQIAAQARAARAAGSAEAPALEREARDLIEDYVNQSILVRTQELILLENHVKAAREELRRDALNVARTVARVYREKVEGRAALPVGGPDLGATKND